MSNTIKKEDPKKDPKQMSAGELSEKLNESLITGEEIPLTMEEQFAIFENIDSDELVNLTAEYFNFKTFGEYHFYFDGISTAKMEDKVIDVVMLRDKQNVSWINGNAVLVNSCRKITTIPCYLRIKYTEDVKAPGGGKYKKMDISHFPIPEKNGNGK